MVEFHIKNAADKLTKIYLILVIFIKFYQSVYLAIIHNSFWCWKEILRKIGILQKQNKK